MWKRIKRGWTKEVVFNKPETDPNADLEPELGTITTQFANEIGEFLFYSDTIGGYVILKDFPSLVITCENMPKIAGTYEFLPNYNSKKAVYSNGTIHMMVVKMESDADLPVILAFSETGEFHDIPDVNWGFTGRVVQDLNGVVTETTKEFSMWQRYWQGNPQPSSNAYFKDTTHSAIDNSIGDTYVNLLRAIDPLTGLVGSTIVKKVDFTIVMDSEAEYSTALSFFDTFEGSYGQRDVGWLWFLVGSVANLYKKGSDITEDNGEWSVVHDGKRYYGEEPTKGASVTFSIPSDKQEDPLIPDIVLEYTTSKYNDFADSHSIPNSTEVTDV